MKRFTKGEAIKKLESLISMIQFLKQIGQESPEFNKWHRDTEIAIEYIFNKGSRHLNDFNNVTYHLGAFTSYTPDSEFREAFRSGLDEASAILNSMIDEIKEYWEEDTSAVIKSEPVAKLHGTRDKIFIIHGHDELMKRDVQLLLSRASLDDVVLHESPDKGRTVIDKLIEEGSSATYVIALLSPDDKMEDGQPRARQNVILEVGYFLGKLGKDKIRLLRKGQVEIPSDLLGIIYQNYDDAGAWKAKLLKEMQAVGIDFDLDKAIQKL